MTDWRAVYESWDQIPDKNKMLIEKLMREKPKEKLADLFSRQPYAKMVYEKVVGKWDYPENTEFQEKTASESVHHASFGSITTVFLPAASLTLLLLAEISYYNPSLTVFLDQMLPLNLKAWIVLLAVASALGSTSILYLLKQLNNRGLRSKLRILP